MRTATLTAALTSATLATAAWASPTLVFNTDTTRSNTTDTVAGTGTIDLSAGAILTLGDTGSAPSPDYYWDGGTGAGGQKTQWNVNDGGIYVSADAELNNNEAKGAFLADKIINADQFVVWGDSGGSDYIEFEDGFNADLGAAAGGAGPTNIQGGLSTIRVNDTIYRTHASANLPSVWKHTQDNQGGGTAVTHHGLIFFEDGDAAQNPAGNSAVWEVRSNSQMYDGGINWSGDWELDVAAGLTLINDTTFEQNLGPHVGFGDSRNTVVGSTVTKTGTGTLMIARGGIQHYAPGAALDIQQGTVEFNSNPTQTDPTFYSTSAAGQNLDVQVSNGAAAKFHSYTWPYATNWWEASDTRVDNQHEIEALTSSGTVTLGGLSGYTPRGVDLETDLAVPETAGMSDAFLEIADDATFTGTSLIEIYLSAADAADDFQVDVGGTLSQGGLLSILDTGDLAVGDYDLFDASTFSGAFSLQLPGYITGSYNDTTGVLSITQVIPEPASAALVAAGLGLVLLRRRSPRGV